jgi:AraC-like DNA-binding protein
MYMPSTARMLVSRARCLPMMVISLWSFHDGHLTRLDIAMQVGFNAKSSFYTAFKTFTGLTPSQYRHTTRANHDI